MKFVRREEYGLPADSPAPDIAGAKGVKVHYLGTHLGPLAHMECDDFVRKIRAAHLANKAEGYLDIAYNLLVCEHGTVYEGRGAHKRTGANGNQTLNRAHYAVCALLGSSGVIHPSDAQLHGLRDAIEYLREHGDAGDEIKGHRDGWATECPGDVLYAWVEQGAPRPCAASGASNPPAKKPPAKKTAPAKPATPPFPGRDAFRIGQRHPAVTQLDRQLIKRGFDRHHDGNGYQAGPLFTKWTVRNVADFQRSRAELRGDPDGYPGPLTWRLLFS